MNGESWMNSAKVSVARHVHLDMLRGLAAIVVLIGHARAFVFLPYASLEGASLGTTTVFYAATSLGHQAVMTFFVLSGFLVGGQAWLAIRQARWSWRRYALRRATRLWIVLIPGLFLTFMLDMAGIAWTASPSGYAGDFSYIYPSLQPTGSEVDLSAKTLAGNFFFLQTIATPVYGSNGPLWSLANEFWYYVVFPFVAIAVHGGSYLVRVLSGGFVAIILWLLPSAIVIAGIIWLAGVGAAVLARGRFATSPKIRTPTVLAFALIAPLSVLTMSLQPATDPGNITLGLVIAMSIVVLSNAPSPGHWYEQTARALSEISFTLYVTHFPVLMLVAMLCFAPERLAPGVDAFLRFGALVAIAFIVAGVFWMLFERHTDRLFQWTLKRLPDKRILPR
jgi:peptidoglycan/LPS O-acetylase OafA/YrhL